MIQAVSTSGKKPEPDYLKINTDGAYDVDSLAGGTDAVIRNDDGTFVKAISRRLASTLVAEAEAWRDGLRLLEPTHQQVNLETDSVELLAL
jgi:ribonuclease HI